MSLLQNKRNREESINDFDIKKNSQMKLDENSSCNNKINNINSFQKSFKSINSRKDDIFQNNRIISPLLRSNLQFLSYLRLKNSDKLSPNEKTKLIFPKNISSIFNNKISSSNSKKKSDFSRSISLKLVNSDELPNNNLDKFPIDFGQNDYSEKENIFDFNSDKQLNQDNLNILGVKSCKFFGNKSLCNSNSIKNNMQYSF